MRWMRDVVAAVGLLGLVGGSLYLQRAHRQEESVFAQAQTDVHRMELEIKYRAATKTTELNARGWPVTIDPSWFQDNAPANTLLDEDRPWVEVAGTAQADLQHPPVRMAVDKALAAFWYNPYQGVVRARVPVMVSDDKATELYNRVNSTAMASIFVREPAIDRAKAAGAASAKTTVTKTSDAKPGDTKPADAAAPDSALTTTKSIEKPTATFTIMSGGAHKHAKR